MRHLRVVLALATLVAACFFAAPAGARRSSLASSPVQLRGENSFQVRHGLEVSVEVPVTTRFSDIDLKIDGKGSSAFALVALSGTEQDPLLFALRDASCGGGTCPEPQMLFSADGFRDFLPAGAYRLILLNDRTTTYSLRFKNLSGNLRRSGNLRPDSAQLHTLKMEPLDSSPQGVHSAGIFQKADPDSGKTIMFQWWRSDSYVTSAFSSCYYIDRPDMSQYIAFAPGCPTARSHPKVDTSTTPGSADGTFLLSIFDFVPAGVGGWFANPGPGSAAGGAVVLTLYPE